MRIGRVVSGGQSGVDRAALDAAIACGVPYGGWCPHGGAAEDVTDVRVPYPCLRETPLADVSQRTSWNVRDSDATLVVTDGSGSPGTDLTVACAQRLGRPLLVAADVADVLAWLPGPAEPMTLNVAGPRASEWPGGYDVAVALMRAVLDVFAARRDAREWPPR
jgi:hypothetical protein